MSSIVCVSLFIFVCPPYQVFTVCCIHINFWWLLFLLTSTHPRAITATHLHSFPQLVFCTAINHFFVDFFDMVMMHACAPIHNRQGNKSTICSSSRQHIQCSDIFIVKKKCGCLVQVDFCATTSFIHHHKSVKKLSQRSLT